MSGANRRIHHAINKARDAINSTTSTKAGCALLDLDFIAAFCFQTLEWVLKVARAKGLDKRVIDRINNVSFNRVSTPLSITSLARPSSTSAAPSPRAVPAP